jgi:hypothetical protein
MCFASAVAAQRIVNNWLLLARCITWQRHPSEETGQPSLLPLYVDKHSS